VKAEDIKAEYVDGILEIHVPKALEAVKPKTTKVSIGTTVEQPKLEGENA